MADTKAEFSAAIDVGNLGYFLQEVTGWGVDIPSGMLDDVVPADTYGPDEFEDVLASIGTATGFTVSFNDTTGVITFAE